MNERILELAEQAGIHPTNFESDADIKEPLKKFAELIVKECARIIVNNGIATAQHDQLVRQDCAKEIGDNFGVEL